MKKIKLFRGELALVDNDDYVHLSKFSWYFNKGYVVSSMRVGLKYKKIYMHREVLKPQSGKFVDHINRNTLDNRQKNLRECTARENSLNRARPKNNTSGYKGVFTRNNGKTWMAKINIRGKEKRLGTFEKKKIAALAYDEAVLNNFGEFSVTNFQKLEASNG